MESSVLNVGDLSTTYESDMRIVSERGQFYPVAEIILLLRLHKAYPAKYQINGTKIQKIYSKCASFSGKYGFDVDMQ